MSQFGTQGINFAVTILLARLLGPEEFGLVGMATVVTAFVGYFTEFGLTPTLIRKRDVDELDLQTVFWGTLAFAVVVYAFMFTAGAAWISRFYGASELRAITRVVFVYFLVMPFGFIPQILDIRALRYERISKIELASTLVAGLAVFVLALSGFGVWSIVLQHVIRAAVRSLLLVLLLKWSPRLTFSFERFRKLLGSGMQFTANNLFQYASENVDFLLVGRILGQGPLGYYTMAFRLSKYPIQKLWGVFGKMLFPAFSTMQDDHDTTRRYHVGIAGAVSFIFVPVLIFLFFTVESLIHFSVGDKWLPVAALVRIYFPFLVVSSFCFHDDPVLLARGRVRTVNIFKASSSVVLLIVGYLLMQANGLAGMALAYSAVWTVYLLSIKVIAIHALGMRIRQLLVATSKVAISLSVLFVVAGLYVEIARRSEMSQGLLLAGQMVIVASYYGLMVVGTGFYNVKERQFKVDRIIRLDQISSAD